MTYKNTKDHYTETTPEQRQGTTPMEGRLFPDNEHRTPGRTVRFRGVEGNTSHKLKNQEERASSQWPYDFTAADGSWDYDRVTTERASDGTH